MSVVRSALIALAAVAAAQCEAVASVKLTLQRRTADDKHDVRIVTREESVEPARAAVVVVDMWNQHWCKTLSARTAALVGRMNRALAAARKLGMPVVFMPSDTMATYTAHPARKAAAALAKSSPPNPAKFDPPKPIGGGCCCGPKRPCKSGRAWTAQHPQLKILDGDFLTDSAGELYNLCAARRITHLFYLGVHTNMCVLYRPFGMVNMTRLGLKCVLVRDLTDAATANDPNKGLTPDSGTAAVVAHIERHVAPTVDSFQLLRAAGTATQPPLKVLLLSGCWEYDSAASCAILKAYVEKHHAADCTLLHAQNRNDLPGLEALDVCDVMFLFTRRLNLRGRQLERFRSYCTSGRPIVGVRTASHAVQSWLKLDGEVLGGDYSGHYGRGSGKTTLVPGPAAKGHPILDGVKLPVSGSWLYKNPEIAKDCVVLLIGTAGERTEPVAWTRVYKDGRVFYTSLGSQVDFRDENFLRMLANALFWTAQRRPTKVGQPK